MKHRLVIAISTFILYFIGIGILITWDIYVVGQAVFTNYPNWFPLHQIVSYPPVFAVYFCVGALYFQLFNKNPHKSIFIVAIFILLWKLLLSEHIWYIEPSIVNMLWVYIGDLLPSISVLIGYFVVKYIYRYRYRFG